MTIIQVTQHHISGGFIGEPWSCPIALAISDQLKCKARVSRTQIKIIYDGDESYRFGVSEDVLARIVEYDLGRRMSPFSFELGTPLPVEEE